MITRYSAQIVYNNFPWPDLPEKLEPNQPQTPAHKAQAAIEKAAQAVLDARAQFPGSSLADLYDPLTMPPALLKAHQKLDAAVDAAYALVGGKKTWKNDAERVAFLFERYQHLTSLLPAVKGKGKEKTKGEGGKQGAKFCGIYVDQFRDLRKHGGHRRFTALNSEIYDTISA